MIIEAEVEEDDKRGPRSAIISLVCLCLFFAVPIALTQIGLETDAAKAALIINAPLSLFGATYFAIAGLHANGLQFWRLKGTRILIISAVIALIFAGIAAVAKSSPFWLAAQITVAAAFLVSTVVNYRTTSSLLLTLTTTLLQVIVASLSIFALIWLIVRLQPQGEPGRRYGDE